MRNTYRVSYFKNGSEVTSFVCAESGEEAITFLGIVDTSGASVNTVARNVEVAGVDASHPSIPPMPVNVAPFDVPKVVSRQEVNTMVAGFQEQINGLQKQIADLAGTRAPAK